MLKSYQVVPLLMLVGSVISSAIYFYSGIEYFKQGLYWIASAILIYSVTF